MSENRSIEDFTSNGEKGEINRDFSGEMENETNEIFEFEEETLQITDVGALEHTVGEYPVHGTAELSSTSKSWTSGESPASIERFLDQATGNDTHHGAVDLQSEFAALGLNSLYPLARPDVDSSFDVSFERHISFNNHISIENVRIKSKEENNLLVSPAQNSIKTNSKLSEDMNNEDFKVSCRKPDDISFVKLSVSKDLSSTEDSNSLNVSLKKDTMSEIIPDSHRHYNNDVKVIDSSLNMGESDNCEGSSNGVYPPQAACGDKPLEIWGKGDMVTDIVSEDNFNDKAEENKSKPLEIWEKGNMVTDIVSEDNFNDKAEENKSHILNLSGMRLSEMFGDTTEYVQINSDHGDLESEENNDIFEDAVDSLVLKETVPYSDENKSLDCDISHTEYGHNFNGKSLNLTTYKTIDPSRSKDAINKSNEVRSSGSEKTVGEMHQNHQFRFEVCIEGPDEIELIRSEDIDKKLHKLEQLTAEEVAQEIHESEQVQSKHAEETYKVKSYMSEEAFEKVCTEELKEVAKEMFQVDSSSFEGSVKGENLMEQSRSEQIKDSLEVEPSNQESVEENKLLKQSRSTIFEEICQLKPSILEENAEETHQVEPARFENVVDNSIILEPFVPVETVKEPQQMEPSRWEGILQKTQEVEPSMCEEAVEETYVLEQCTSDEVIDKTNHTQTFVLVGVAHQVDPTKSKEELQVIQSFSSEDIIEETSQPEPSMSGEDFQVTHPLEQSSNKVTESTRKIELSPSVRGMCERMLQPEDAKETDKIEPTSSDKLIQWEKKEELSRVEDDKDTCKEETFESEDTVNEIQKAELSRLEDIVDETYPGVLPIPDVAVEEICQMKLNGFKEAVEETCAMEVSMSEEVVNEIQIMQQCIPVEVFEDTPEIELSRSGNFVRGTGQTVLSGLEEVERSHQLEPSSNEEGSVLVQSRSDEAVGESHTMEVSKHKEFIEQVSKSSRSEEIVKESPQPDVSKFGINCEEPHKIELSTLLGGISEEILTFEDVEETQKNSPSMLGQKTKEENPMEPSKIDDNKETCELDKYKSENIIEETQKMKLPSAEDFVEETHSEELSMYDKVLTPTHQEQQCVSQEAVEELQQILSRAEEISGGTGQMGPFRLEEFRGSYQIEPSQYDETPLLVQCRSAEVVEETFTMEVSRLEGVVNETLNLEPLGSIEDVEEIRHLTQGRSYKATEETKLSTSILGACEELLKTEDLKEIHKIELSTPEELLKTKPEVDCFAFEDVGENCEEETSVLEEYLYENKQLELSIVVKSMEEIHQVELPCHEEMFEEKRQTKLSGFLHESYQEQIIISEESNEIIEGTGQMKLSGCEKVAGSHQIEPSRYGETVNEMSPFVQCGSEKVLEGTYKINLSGPEEVFDDDETHQMDLLQPQESPEGTHKIELNKSEGLVKETQRNELSVIDKAEEEIHEVQLARSIEFSQEIQKDDMLKSENIVEETRQTELSRSEEDFVVIHKMELAESKEIVERTHEIVPNRSEEVQELHVIGSSGCFGIAEKTYEVGVFSSNTVIEETPLIELSRYEEKDETHEEKLSTTEELNEVEQSRFEEFLEETHTKINGLNENVRKSISPSSGDRAQTQTDFGSDSSYYCQQTQDMSLTIVGTTSNNLNTSKLESSEESEIEKSQSPSNMLSQTFTDLLNNIEGIEDTNDFISHSDQKMYDALYVPLSESDEINSSVADNCLQSFMEITMANTSQAMIEQNLNTTKQNKSNHTNQSTYHTKECTTDSKLGQSLGFNFGNKELIPCCDDSSSSEFLSELECDSNKTHEMMQQSMCDYVTNLSLKLAIPDSDNFSGVSHPDDEESRKKCEEQTESVLLMKWPAQYYDDLKTLKQQNQLLSESIKKKDAYINNLKYDNEDLFQQLSEVIGRSDEIKHENGILKNESNKDKDLIVELQQENKKLLKDLETLKCIESEFSNFKIKNEDLLLTIEKSRSAKEGEIKVFKDRIDELEHELLKIGQTVIDFQSQNEELSKLVKNIHDKESEIEKLLKDKKSLEEKVLFLGTHLETLDEVKQENNKLKDVLEMEREKCKDMEILKMMSEEQINEICHQKEILAKLDVDLNEKEQQIQTLFEDKVSLGAIVASLNKHVEELKEIENENQQLKSDLQEEKNKREEMEVLSKSLEDHTSLNIEKISALTNEIIEKDLQIEALLNSKSDLKEIIDVLNQRLEELKDFEIENGHLKMTIKQGDEKMKEIKNLKTTLEEQVKNLNAQNELLWNELKVSSTKEQSLYTLKEERLLLEEKLTLMKKEIQEINNLKSDNEHLVDELAKKDLEIRSLTADKKKLKSSLIKVNDKLNERDAEIDKLSETLQYLDERLNVVSDEKTELQVNFDKVKKIDEELKEELEYERHLLADNIGNVSEYLSSVIFENAYLAEELIGYETGDKQLTEEIMALRKKIIEEKMLSDDMQSQKEILVNTVDNLKTTVTGLTEKLNQYECLCNEVTGEKQSLALKINDLNETIKGYEEEKTCTLVGMSSLSESISNLLTDRLLLSDQFKLSEEMSERIAFLTAEKSQLEQQMVQHEQNNLVLLQSISALQNRLENDKDKINYLNDFVKSLEEHFSSMNEELMSEMSKNQFLTVTINELESQLCQNNEEILVLQNRISSLIDQQNLSRDKDNAINDLETLVRDLENHMSSLNEELMSEIAKTHFLSVENENLEYQQNEVIKEKLLLENIVSQAQETFRNRLQKTKNVNNKQVSLQTYINEILLEISSFECENVKLTSDINNVQMALQISSQNLSDLMKAKHSLELELSTSSEQKLELENKLTLALAKESHMRILQEENESLLKISETHKYCEGNIRQLQNEKSSLEVQIKTLTESIEVLRCKQHEFDTQIKENLQLKEVMTKEIHSLTGEIKDFNVEPLIDIYQQFMKEFLNKEKEVIFSLQNECEGKIKITQDKVVSLNNELDAKKVLTSELESELEKCKMELNQRDTLISGLENELRSTKNELNTCSSEINEIKLWAEKEKETLISEMNSELETKLQENLSILSNEINFKNQEIVQLKNDLENMHCENKSLLRQAEENLEISKHQKDLIEELTSRLNDNQELLSQLNLQLQNKNNEVSQLSEFIEKNKIETRQHLMRIEEISPAILKVNTFENEVDLIKNILTSQEEFDGEALIGSLKTCQVLGDIMQLVVSKFIEMLNQLHTANDNLRLEVSKQVEMCKCLETQINDMNEELKSHKLLYDEDSLQFKEEIASKNFTITNLTEALEKLKTNARTEAEDLKTDTTEMENVKEELHTLREENKKLHDESTKISYLTEVNRKLSWEIEELSRSIKFEKQSNIDLKAKCDLATNQVADLSKKNFQLEDKIDVLESKLQNHDVMSSLKIGFPLGINTVDKQVQYLNEKLVEFDQISSKFNNLKDEHSSLKMEYEKSKEYIKKQDEKLSKIMKRELELKKQITSNLQTAPDMKILTGLKTELLSLFPGKNLSLAEALLKIKSLVEEEKKIYVGNNSEIEDLKQKIEELSQENKDFDTECEMMNKHIKEQEELLATVFKREEELKNIITELKSQLPTHLLSNTDQPVVDINLKELFEVFPEKPVSIKDSINLIKLLITENQVLKEKISDSQEEYASLDKECEDMFKAYKEKEKDLADVLKREASSVSILKNKQIELEGELKTLLEDLQLARSQLEAQDNPTSVQAACQCEELKSRLSEIKVDLAERNAKITALELQFEADNFPLKKKVADLEKSLDQAKQKVNELKSEVRRYQEQMCDVTVGLRAECERCRNVGTPAEPASSTALTALQHQLQEKNKEINILKALCKTRNKKIKELEERDGSHKMPWSQRSALKEVKENQTVPPSPTKPSKGSLH